MKCSIPEIAWHNKSPVLSIDIQQIEQNFYKIASAGADCHVILWHLYTSNDHYKSLEPVADLRKHQKPVNIVRWAPSTSLLASGDDESIIIVWRQKMNTCEDDEVQEINNDEFQENKNNNDNNKTLEAKDDEFPEHWSIYKILRGHLEDVCDLTWFLDSSKIISGSIDNSVIIWDVTKGKKVALISGHNGFVQGVTVDPNNQIFATACSDRNLRIFDVNTKKLLYKIDKAVLPFSEEHVLYNVPIKLFYDDTLKVFYRRLSFSPDGLFLAVPSGFIYNEDKTIKFNATYLFSRHDFKQPLMCIPSDEEYSIAVKFCPIIFELNQNGPNSILPLPYRMVFAVALRNSVIICDTQQEIPLLKIMDIHYTRLTDLSWSHDGRILLISSSDGYCTFVTFAENELGIKSSTLQKCNLNEFSFNDSIVESAKLHNESSPVVKMIAVKRKPKVSNDSNLIKCWTKKSKISNS